MRLVSLRDTFVKRLVSDADADQDTIPAYQEMMKDLIKKYRLEAGLTQEQLGERVGVEKAAVSKWETGRASPDIPMLNKIAKALGIDIARFLSADSAEVALRARIANEVILDGARRIAGREIEAHNVDLRPIWIKGEVQAGAWFEAAEWPQDQWEPAIGVDRQRFPYRDMFAVRVRGRSMDLVFPPGTVLICAGAAFDRETPHNGDYVIVHRRGKGGDLWEATVKHLEVANDGVMRLWARSSLPEFAEPIESRAEEGDDVQIVGIVLQSVIQFRR